MATLVAPLPVPSCIPDHMTDARQQSVSADLPKLQPISPARKPKLSLQTTSLTSAYGSLSRGIAPNTAQATYTPTTTNTLSNQWDLSIRPSPISRTESPRPVPSKQQHPYTLTLPFGVRSILKNSPLPRQASVSASPRDSRRRVFFPQPKKVSFRPNLEDAIETKEYIVRHADLSSSDEESSSEGSSLSASQNNSEDDLAEYPSPPPSRKRKIRRETLTPTEPPAQDKDTQSGTAADDDGSFKHSHSCKRRKWQWTLPAPIQPSSENSESTPATNSPASLNTSDLDSHSAEQPEEQQEASHLDTCEACAKPDLTPIPKTDTNLGSPPDVSKPESESQGVKVTCQDNDDDDHRKNS